MSNWIEVCKALPVCNEYYAFKDQMTSRKVLVYSPTRGVEVSILYLNNDSPYGYKTMGKTAKWGNIYSDVSHWMDLPKIPEEIKEDAETSSA